MIRTRVIVEAKPLFEFESFAADFINVAADLARESYREIAPAFREELAFVPGPSKHPFIWSKDDEANERARRWWFANIADGNIPTDGTRYKRSGAYGESWNVRLEINGSEFELIAETKYRGAKYIGGTFDRNRSYQIPGHERTGWPKSQETTDFWQQAFLDDFRQRFVKVIDSTLGQFDSRRRNR